MAGLIADGQLVQLEPIRIDPEVGDVVLVRCHGRVYLHLIKARQAERYLIGNNRGGINGWVGRGAIYGKAVL
jgi:hypothetical protein